MPPRVISNTIELGQEIKKRRTELGYTLEEAAKKAGVGIKTWSRYEAGESIRSDKLGKVLRTLKWNSFPPDDRDVHGRGPWDTVGPSHKAWSPYLARVYGARTASMFAIGYELLSDIIKMDLEALSHLPAGTHVGQLDVSELTYILPAQFLMRYDYEFVYHLQHVLEAFRLMAWHGYEIAPHTVIEELVIHLLEEQANSHMELFGIEKPYGDEDRGGLLNVLCEESEIQEYLYSESSYLSSNDAYYFDSWDEPGLC